MGRHWTTKAAAVLTGALMLAAVVPVGMPRAVAGTSPWRWQNPLPNGESLQAVSLAPGAGSTAVWTVGNHGTVFYSADNGASWIAKPVGTTSSLSGVDMIDDNTGWAVGDFGTVVKIAGGTCSLQAEPTGQHINDVAVINSTHAWAVGSGGAIIRTVNGTDWTSVTSPTSEYLTAVQFLNANEGWIAGLDNALYYTADGGATWRFKGTADSDFQINDFAVVGDTVWAVGRNSAWEPRVYKASDGKIRTNLAADEPLYASVSITGMTQVPSAICMLDTTHIWFSGQQGGVFFHNGVTFAEQTVPYDYRWLRDIDFRTATTGVFVGSGGAVGRSNNGGSTWTARTSFTDDPIFGIDFISLTTGYATRGASILKTADGGQTWTTMSTGQGRNLLSVDFLDAAHGAAVGQSGTILLNTGGSSWTPISGPSPSIEFRGVCYQSATRLWACGGNGTIGWWDGSTWNAVADSKAGTSLLFDIDFFDATRGIAVGTNGTVVYTTDGGATWTAGVSDEVAGEGIFGVEMVSSTVGFMVGDDQNNSNSGMIMKKTTNGGATWTPMIPPAGEAYLFLEDVSFADANNGWIVGGSVLYRTADGGTTWTSESATNAWLDSVSAFSPTAVWVGTNYGGILTTVPAAVPVKPIPVYRFYNAGSGTHFYTDSETEKNHVLATWPHIYTLDGVGYYLNPANNTTPLTRLYNRVSKSHFYTASAGEAANALATWPKVFSLDGPTYAVNPGPVADSAPVYRFYNLRNGSHFYTASAEEADMVIATWPTVYQLEGPAFWIGQ